MQDIPIKNKESATYNLGLFFGGDVNHQPFDFRQVGLPGRPVIFSESPICPISRRV